MKDHPLLLVPREERRRLLEERCRPTAREGARRDRLRPLRLPARRRALPHVPADPRRAARGVPRRLAEGAAPRPGRALLRLRALPAGGGHGRAAALRRRRVPAGHRGSDDRRAAAGAPLARALRAARSARRREPRAHRVLRPAEARPERVQVPARHERDRPGGARPLRAAARPRARREREREAARRVQGVARVPVVQGAARARARAVPAPRLGGARDLRPADHRRRGREARRAARDARRRAVGGAHPAEAADPGAVPGRGCATSSRSSRRSRSSRLYDTGAAPDRLSLAAGEGAPRARVATSTASRTCTRTTRGGAAPRRARSRPRSSTRRRTRTRAASRRSRCSRSSPRSAATRACTTSCQQEVVDGYHDHEEFVRVVEADYLDAIDEEIRDSMGLVSEAQYRELFGRYVTLVSHWVKGERLRNPLTGEHEAPDERRMAELEKIVMPPGDDRTRVPARPHLGGRRVPARPPRRGRDRLRGHLPGPVPAAARPLLRGAQAPAPPQPRGRPALPLRRARLRSTRRRARQVEDTLRNLRERYGYCEALRAGRGPVPAPPPVRRVAERRARRARRAAAGRPPGNTGAPPPRFVGDVHTTRLLSSLGGAVARRGPPRRRRAAPRAAPPPGPQPALGHRPEGVPVGGPHPARRGRRGRPERVGHRVRPEGRPHLRPHERPRRRAPPATGSEPVEVRGPPERRPAARGREGDRARADAGRRPRGRRDRRRPAVHAARAGRRARARRRPRRHRGAVREGALGRGRDRLAGRVRARRERRGAELADGA